MRLDGRVAAVTGAASGIGRSLARELVRRGSHVALCDVDAEGLASTAAACEGRGVKVSHRTVDVADADAMAVWADEVVATHGQANLIINNAGVAVAGSLAEMPRADLEWLMGINFWGVVNGTTSFLPHLEAAGEGHVVNISSVFGLISVPSQSAYNASKFAVRGYTDALRMELEIAGSPVSCTTVHPGGIRTDIARNARMNDSVADYAGSADEARRGFDRVARTSPDRAAGVILDGVERDRRRVLIGVDSRVIDLASRLPSGWYQRVIVAGARRRRH